MLTETCVTLGKGLQPDSIILAMVRAKLKCHFRQRVGWFWSTTSKPHRRMRLLQWGSSLKPYCDVLYMARSCRYLS